MANAHRIERGMELPNVPVKLPPKNVVLKTIAGITSGAVLAAGIGIGVDKYLKSLDNDNNSNPNNGVKPPIVTELGTPVPSSTTSIPTESTKPVETTSPSTTENNKELQEKLALAPEIAGLNKQIQNKDNIDKVVYIAKADNGYGIKEGDYAGEFKKEVMVENKEVGGVALVPEVAQKILEDELAKIPEGEMKLKVIMPLDITSVSSKVDIKISNTNLLNIKTNRPPIVGISIKCEANVKIVNTMPDVASLYSGRIQSKDGTVWRNICEVEFRTENPIMVNAQANKYLTIMSNGTDFHEKDPYVDLFFGKEMVVKDPRSDLFIYCNDANGNIPIDSSDTLTINNNLVFLIAKSESIK